MFDNFLRNWVNPLGNMPSNEEKKRKKRTGKSKYWTKTKRVGINNEGKTSVGQKGEVTTQEQTTQEQTTQGWIAPEQTTQKPEIFPVGQFTPPQPSRTYKPIKPIKQAKLIIFLIENSDIVCKEEEMVKKIINSQVVENSLFCIISYNRDVYVSDIYEARQMEEVQLIDKEKISEELCLYDALLKASIISQRKWYKNKEEIPQEYRINSAELIGIGRCIDTCSKSSKEDGINAFCQISFATKYYCIDDSYFVNSAEIGFRSIGAIKRNFFM